MTQAAARLRAERINFHIIGTYAARRAMAGVGLGARVTPGAARGFFDLAQIEDVAQHRDAEGRRCSVKVLRTDPGCLTARRRLPAVLGRMADVDPRRRAAERYAYASEKIGSIAGTSAEGAKSDGGAATNDGGVTSRIMHASAIRSVERVLDAVGNVLTPSARGGGQRRAISARELMDALCLEGCDMKAILTRAGWSGQRRDVAALSASAEVILEGMARALGLIATAARLESDDETPLGFCNAQNKTRALT
ncbi:hypothetical protein SAMN05444149_10892 [Pseudosulfitobacter pseudonitzschiae]|uniref:Uncharacterized protein n=1 Tax=Pseudosulfitobacter pseudonitzschiae TaxID=1402135 RepID=A0A073IWK0_9RHOB|nr:hypothetical protein [Pseudosulfitobacter pseudonitzschiae]KEJ93975.1 hypothetical protein SUH3_11940 [Pseudosulfitobacter pseudonitzschiae]SHG01409.1 hypothetical protein SAMN05444149_10892 [Pseudosulfitobacter pseudonitzschiae]